MAATTMESATTMGAASAMESTAAMKATSSVSCISMPNKRMAFISVTDVAVAVISMAIVSTAVVSTTVVSAAPSPASVVPGAGADKYAVQEPVRSVVTIWSTGIWIIIVVPVLTDGRSLDVSRADSNSDSKTHLGLREC